MQSKKKLGNDINYKRERIVRVIVHWQNGNTSLGTGFFIDNKGDLLTCFHVVFGGELRNIRLNQTYSSINGQDEHDKLQNYHSQLVTRMEVEFFDGNRKSVNLVKFNEFYDVALLKLDEEIETVFFNLSMNDVCNYDETTFFCGYQLASGYINPETYPFSTNRAVVSSFPVLAVAGDLYEHIQLNSINLGGNSGAPLFKENDNNVIGIINGNMNWGADNLAFINNVSGVQNIMQASLRVPLSIAFATTLKTIKDNTKIIG